MGSALRYEWRRVRTLRSTWVLIATAVALQFLCAAVWGSHHDMTELDRLLSSFVLSATLGGVFAAAIGVTAFGNEYQHRTINITLLTVRSRSRVLAAKAAVIAAVGAATGLTSVAAAFLGLLTTGDVPGWSARVAAAGVGMVLYMTASGLVGLAVAGLVRHAVAALAVVIVWPTVLEPLVIQALKIKPWFVPFLGMKGLFSPSEPVQWLATLPMLILTVVLLSATAVALTRRDA